MTHAIIVSAILMAVALALNWVLSAYGSTVFFIACGSIMAGSLAVALVVDYRQR